MWMRDLILFYLLTFACNTLPFVSYFKIDFRFFLTLWQFLKSKKSFLYVSQFLLCKGKFVEPSFNFTLFDIHFLFPMQLLAQKKRLIGPGIFMVIDEPEVLIEISLTKPEFDISSNNPTRLYDNLYCVMFSSARKLNVQSF